MGMTKKINIDGKDVMFKASAAIPRIYRLKFHRDIYKDLRDLEKAVDSSSEEQSSLDLFSLEMFENIAFIMAKHADPTAVPDSRKIGWTSLTPSPSTRSCRRSSSFGV